jgi:hypothetical protein
MIENMDAKLTLMLGLCRGEQQPGVEGNWTEYVKAMQGKLYRPDVAPADREVAAPDAPEEPAPAFQPISSPLAAPVVTAAPAVAAVAAGPAKDDDMAINNPLFESASRKR